MDAMKKLFVLVICFVLAALACSSTPSSQDQDMTLVLVNSQASDWNVAPASMQQPAPGKMFLTLVIVQPGKDKGPVAEAVSIAYDVPPKNDDFTPEEPVECVTKFGGPGAHGQNPCNQGQYNGEGTAIDPGPHPAQDFPDVGRDVNDDGQKGARNGAH
jgi:hypothetical protein